MSEATTRNKIRESIEPFPHTPRYPTGWGGDLTFEEIAEQLSPMMANKLRRFGNYGQDIPDSIQTGLMRLWMRLVEDPNLLADVGIFGAMWRTLAISKHTTLEKQRKKYIPFTNIESELAMDVDEFGIPGYSSPTAWQKSPERWAPWATKIDFRLDITEAIHAIAEEYADDIKGLVALYILTTNVEQWKLSQRLNIQSRWSTNGSKAFEIAYSVSSRNMSQSSRAHGKNAFKLAKLNRICRWLSIIRIDHWHYSHSTP